MGVETRDEVSALARGLALLRAVAEGGAPLSNRDLAERSGIPKATVSRLTATLQGAGLLQLSPDERFTLGPAALHLGNAYLRGFDFRALARPHLAELAEAAGANVHLGVREGADMLVIDTVHPRSALILSRMDIGSRMRIATSAMGRAYLAALPAPQCKAAREQLRADGLDAHTDAQLDAALAAHRQRGFSVSFGEWHPEIHALGFSLRGPRDELYGVSVGGPAYKLPVPGFLEQVGPRLLAVQRVIESAAGHA